MKCLNYCDIGANLLDDMFQGRYNERQVHEPDLERVLQRGNAAGVSKVIITAGTSSESIDALSLARRFHAFGLHSTVGVHPTRCSEFSNNSVEQVMNGLEQTISLGSSDKTVVAIGECGLDYDRLHFCSRELQLIGFRAQIDMADRLRLPMFLHNRSTNGEFLRVVGEERSKIRGGGVVHSFDGSVEEMHALVDLGFYIGINGCSLKTDEQLQMVVEIPDDHLLIETDAPWCGVKNTHAGKKHVKTDYPVVKKEKFAVGSMVKDRCEPCHIVQVLEILAAVREAEVDVLGAIVHDNSCRLFNF